MVCPSGQGDSERNIAQAAKAVNRLEARQRLAGADRSQVRAARPAADRPPRLALLRRLVLGPTDMGVGVSGTNSNADVPRSE